MACDLDKDVLSACGWPCDPVLSIRCKLKPSGWVSLGSFCFADKRVAVMFGTYPLPAWNGDAWR